MIAYPLQDIVSYAGGKKKTKPVYQTRGMPTKVVDIRDNMLILENKSGVRFPCNKDRLIWCEATKKIICFNSETSSLKE